MPNEGSRDTDDTGRVNIYCPAQTSTHPTGIDQLLYRPRTLLDETIRSYAGLEKAILEPRAHVFPQSSNSGEPVEVFDESDPLMEFIFTRREALNMNKHDVAVLDAGGALNGKRYYQISDDFLQHIRNIFRDTVFEDFRYTRFEELYVHVELPAVIREDFYNRFHTSKTPMELPTLFIVLEFVYLLITPGELKTRHRETRLK